MNARGINRGTSGNVGARCGDRLLITPSGLPYEAMTPEDIVAMPLDADDGRYEGALAPSSEWRFHRDILRARPAVGALVHTHSTSATPLADRKSVGSGKSGSVRVTLGGSRFNQKK